MRLAATVLTTLFLILLLLPGTCPAGDDTLRVGRISNNPKKHYARVKAFADYLSAHLAHLGYEKSEVVFANNLEQMAALLRRGNVDVISETAYAAAYLAGNSTAQILLREWRDGVDSYKSVLFKHKDSPIASITDLEGKVIAFEDRASTSGYYLPSQEIEKAGLTLVEKKFPDQKLDLDPGQVGFVFARQEINVALWVQEGLVDAGAISDIAMAGEENVPETVLPFLEPFHLSESYPRSLLLVRGTLAPKIRDAIQAVLLNASAAPEALLVLSRYKKVSKYDLVPEQDRKTLETIRLE